MGQYRIIIDRIDNETDEPTIRVIEVSTRYTLQDDITEWATEEIDSDAIVRDIPRTDEFVALFDEELSQAHASEAAIEAAIRAGEEFAGREE